ncbi:MAG: PilZ domain-containing protein [Chromatiales bacterium]|nr:PilZ domain-containing protein [Chromatiales bacterium]
MIVGREEQDRRSLFRMCIECPVEISGLPENKTATGKVIDLSGAGLAMESSERFSQGDRFKVKVVPDKPIFMPLIADVEVVRVDERNDGLYLYGLQIEKIVS